MPELLVPRTNVCTSTFEQFLDRPPIDVVLEQHGVFVGPPEMAGVDPEAVVRAVPRNHRQRILVARLARHHLLAPALLHVLEEVDAVFLLVGEDDVELAVAVEVEEAETGVIAVGIRQRGSGGERELQSFALPPDVVTFRVPYDYHFITLIRPRQMEKVRISF